MRILLDTHIIIWHLTDDKRLSRKNSDLLENESNEKIISMVSLWEIAIKINIGKLNLNIPIDKMIPSGTTLLEVSLLHILNYATLPLHHRDPFDRLLIVQAQTEGLELMTDDPNFPLYDVKIVI